MKLLSRITVGLATYLAAGVAATAALVRTFSIQVDVAQAAILVAYWPLFIVIGVIYRVFEILGRAVLLLAGIPA